MVFSQSLKQLLSYAFSTRTFFTGQPQAKRRKRKEPMRMRVPFSTFPHFVNIVVQYFTIIPHVFSQTNLRSGCVHGKWHYNGSPLERERILMLTANRLFAANKPDHRRSRSWTSCVPDLVGNKFLLDFGTLIFIIEWQKMNTSSLFSFTLSL